MKLVKAIILMASLAAGSYQASALTWLGYFDGLAPQPANTAGPGGNDGEANVEAALTYLGMPTDIVLFGKSDDGLPLNSDFTSAPNDLNAGSVTSGSITYSGLANIGFITFKVGNVGGGNPSTPPGNGYHLYAWDGGGSFNLLTDPTPDFPSQGNSVSHYTVWLGRQPGPPVPDGGATWLLLSGALTALALARRGVRR